MRNDEACKVMLIINDYTTALKNIRIFQYTDDEMDVLEAQRFIINRRWERAMIQGEIEAMIQGEIDARK
jgi:hypothetical protein